MDIGRNVAEDIVSSMTSTGSKPTKPALPAGAAWADEAFARAVLPRRQPGAHKWGVGGVLVIAGSPAFVGAAYLASRTAGRAGAGIVRLGTGRQVIAMLAGAMPEVAYVSLPETDAPGAARKAVERLEDSFRKCRAVLVGPGLGDDELTDHLMSAMFGLGGRQQQAASTIGFGVAAARAGYRGPQAAPLFVNEELRVVVDADALKWLARQDEWWTKVPAGRLVLTPHPGELEALSGKSAEEITADPAAVARECAGLWRQTVVVKAGFSAVSDGERTLVSDDAPLSLATAGSGDVLAGALAGFVAQGVASVDAAGLALHLGTRASRALEAEFGELGVLATDMPEAVAREIAKLA